MSDRVIVVTHDESGQLLKVCESWTAYDEWLGSSDWSATDTDTWDSAVYEESGP